MKILSVIIFLSLGFFATGQDLKELKLDKCDTVERPVVHVWEHRGPANISSYKWELELTHNDKKRKKIVDLTWTEATKSKEYFLIVQNVFDEIVFIERTDKTNYTLDKSQFPTDLTVYIITQSCEQSNTIGLRTKANMR